MTDTLQIGFDAKRAFFNHTGLGNYSRNLLAALAQYYPQHRYHLYSPSVPRTGIDPLLQNPPFVAHYPTGFIDRMFPFLWRSVMLGSQIAGDGIQLFHGLSNELPFDILESKVRSVVTIHDLIFLDRPELYPKIDRQIYRTKTSMACERANHIIAISEQTKQSIIRHFGIRESKISVVYQSCHPAFLEVHTGDLLASVKAQYRLPDRYVLYVGAIAERKQTMELVEAFKLIDDKSISLVLVGDGGPYRQQVESFIKNNGLMGRVMFLKNVPVVDLAAIYRQGLAMVYPSLMEGFGIPIIEALHSGVPVITTAGGCFEEAGGGAANYVIPGDDYAFKLAQAITEVTSSQELRNDMISKGQEHAKLFTPRAFADGVMDVYRKIMV